MGETNNTDGDALCSNLPAGDVALVNAIIGKMQGAAQIQDAVLCINGRNCPDDGLPSQP